MQPSVLLAHELVKKGVGKARIAFTLCRVGDGHIEVAEPHNYISDGGHKVLASAIPEKSPIAARAMRAAHGDPFSDAEPARR